MSAGHTEGPWHIHYKADHKDGADLPWIGGHMGKPLAFITHETILKEDFERANCNARLIVAACNSYDRHFGPRAIEAAEADLLGKALEALRELQRNNRQNVTGAEARKTWAKVDAILSQAREVRS